MSNADNQSFFAISVVRHGGVAGLRREWSIQVSDDNHEEWKKLLDACPWDEQSPEQGEPDRYVYLITAGGRNATVPETWLTDSWRRLIDRVREAQA